MPILDNGELLEELFPFRMRFDRGKRAIQERGITLVAVVLVPGGIGLRRIGRRVARMRRRLHIHPASIAALLGAW